MSRRLARDALLVPMLALAACTVMAETPPLQAGYLLAALAPGNQLVLFRSTAPQDTRLVAIRGVTQPVIGIDLRPADGQLYGITRADELIVIDPESGAARVVSVLGSPFQGGEQSGFGFNPQSDRLRLIGPEGQNLRVNVSVGAVAIDSTLFYAGDDQGAGKRPHIVAVGYTNAFAAAPSTVTFDIDGALDTLVRQDPPNDGVLQTVGPLGIDCGDAAGFDIVSPRRGVDDALLVCARTLYSVSLTTGAARAIGPIASEAPSFLSLAALPDSAK